MKQFTPKTAYLIETWATEMIKGVAFNIDIEDWGVAEVSMFSKDGGKTFKKHNKVCVCYDVDQAHMTLNRERNSYIDYNKREFEKYANRLEKFKNLSPL